MATASGHESSLTYPSGLSMAYAPDGLGRPTQAGTFANSVGYAPNGALAGLYYGNGMHFNQTFNIRQLIGATHYRLTGGGGVRLADRSLTYDANGNLAS